MSILVKHKEHGNDPYEVEYRNNRDDASPYHISVAKIDKAGLETQVHVKYTDDERGDRDSNKEESSKHETSLLLLPYSVKRLTRR